MPNSPYVIEVTDATFQNLVIERSKTTPVVVDFWAPWCGPCRALTPVIEGLANEAGGDWILAKLNTDENPITAQTFRIQGIPNVKGFLGGTVASEFSGALPKPQIEAWLADLLPDVADDPLTIAANALAAGELTVAQAGYEALLKDDPESGVLFMGMAQICFLRGDIVGFQTWFQKITATDPVTTTRSYNELWFGIEAAKARPFDALVGLLAKNPKEVATQYEAGLHAAASNDLETALQHFLEVVKLDRTYLEDIGRTTMIRAFHVLGMDNPRTSHWQNELGRWMY